MTVTYDPQHPLYLDEADVRNELTRVFDLCHGCRLCVEFCTSFPSLFELIDRFDDQDAGRLTPAEQDRVIDECFQCKLCYVNCPYIPELHEWALDFPSLVLRSHAMRHANGQQPVRQRIMTRAVARTDLLGKVATMAAPLANKVIEAPADSVVRKGVARVIGVSSRRLLPSYAKQRFSTWFKKRTSELGARRQGTVTVFPTCVVEYHATGIGKDLVRVYERNGIECANTSAGCCGAPWLHSGDIKHFSKVAERNVETLAREIRNGGGDIVVPQPTCGYVLKNNYVDHVRPASKADAQLVADRTYDAAAYLVKIHRADDTELDTDFCGPVPANITHHGACHLRAQDIGSQSRDLMELTGAQVEVVQQYSGIDGMWGFRAGNEAIAIPITQKLAEQIGTAGGDVVTGDCHLANTAIAEQTGAMPSHPIQLIARAYGIPGD
jgi:Fe-S oxidoreductase